MMKLIEVHENLWIIDKDHDLIFSEFDDEESGMGWYIQKAGRKTSQSFATKSEALDAFKSGALIFSK